MTNDERKIFFGQTLEKNITNSNSNAMIREQNSSERYATLVSQYRHYCCWVSYLLTKPKQWSMRSEWPIIYSRVDQKWKLAISWVDESQCPHRHNTHSLLIYRRIYFYSSIKSCYSLTTKLLTLSNIKYMKEWNNWSAFVAQLIVHVMPFQTFFLMIK